MAKRLDDGETTPFERVVIALLLIGALVFLTYSLVHGQETKRDRLQDAETVQEIDR